MADLPDDLREAIESGRLTRAQLRRLIELEARALNLSVEEAIQRARTGTLPKHYIADDLALLVVMQAAAA